jgi:hypothetical protein
MTKGTIFQEILMKDTPVRCHVDIQTRQFSGECAATQTMVGLLTMHKAYHKVQVHMSPCFPKFACATRMIAIYSSV